MSRALEMDRVAQSSTSSGRTLIRGTVPLVGLREPRWLDSATKTSPRLLSGLVGLASTWTTTNHEMVTGGRVERSLSPFHSSNPGHAPTGWVDDRDGRSGARLSRPALTIPRKPGSAAKPGLPVRAAIPAGNHSEIQLRAARVVGTSVPCNLCLRQ
jgi:hypothetical protein